jgi:GATA-binding protein, other eukaryote
MLAVRSAMDPLNSSTSFGSERESLMRQPSAEDLDAAHQLVSSALGERHVSHVSHDSHVNAATENPSVDQVSPRPEASEPQRSSSEAIEQREDASGLSQVCRYVHSRMVPIPNLIAFFIAATLHSFRFCR